MLDPVIVQLGRDCTGSRTVDLRLGEMPTTSVRWWIFAVGEKEAFIAKHDLCHRVVLRWAKMVANGSIAHFTHKPR